jgi:hypothetical protein
VKYNDSDKHTHYRFISKDIALALSPLFSAAITTLDYPKSQIIITRMNDTNSTFFDENAAEIADQNVVPNNSVVSGRPCFSY